MNKVSTITAEQVARAKERLGARSKLLGNDAEELLAEAFEASKKVGVLRAIHDVMGVYRGEQKDKSGGAFDAYHSFLTFALSLDAPESPVQHTEGPAPLVPEASPTPNTDWMRDTKKPNHTEFQEDIEKKFH